MRKIRAGGPEVEERTVAQLQEELRALMAPRVELLLSRFNRSMVRVQRLVMLLTRTDIDGAVAGDIGRAAVVFLHAALEDFMRTIVGLYLPLAEQSVLDGIPLAGNEDGRPAKFSLGRLVVHREKTVQQVIGDSVEGYLRRLTFNNTTDIASHLRMIGFAEDVRSYYATLDSMMARRHQIVHRADVPGGGHGDDPQDVDGNEVHGWAMCVRGLVSDIVSSDLARFAEPIMRERVSRQEPRGGDEGSNTDTP
jgi:hypothetical protein